MFGVLQNYNSFGEQGFYTQLNLDLDCPPVIELKEEHCTHISHNINIKYDKNGKPFSLLSSKDHPSFTMVREWLGDNGYIHIEDGWSNGDYVLKPFFINDVLFNPDDKFTCASAIKFKLFPKKDML